MTEDFARDMLILNDLINLGNLHEAGAKPLTKKLETFKKDTEKMASDVMKEVRKLKKWFNGNNRKLMMGLWFAGFLDPIDPCAKKQPDINPDDPDPEKDQKKLIDQAIAVGDALITMLDKLKAPHKAFQDNLGSGADLETTVRDVMNIGGVDNALTNGVQPPDENAPMAWLHNRLTALLAFFKGGGGGESTYWPSNYVSSSSSSSSSSSYP